MEARKLKDEEENLQLELGSWLREKWDKEVEGEKRSGDRRNVAEVVSDDVWSSCNKSGQKRDG